MKFALRGAAVFDGYITHQKCALLTQGDCIVSIVPENNIPEDYKSIHLDGGTIAPGFIDLQVNGGGGVLLNNAPTVETLNTMAAGHAKFGVTRILPTVISDKPKVALNAIESAKQCDKQHSGIIGIHVEGPFFNEEKAGVHQSEKLRVLAESDWSWIEQLAALPSILTLAPEKIDNKDIQRIDELGIRVCAGHTNATYSQVEEAHKHGLSGFTHLFNAMSQLQGREPGVVGAALSLSQTWAGLIADGIHAHPASMLAAIKSKGYEHIFLVSDSMANIGTDKKTFELYGEMIEERDGRLVNSKGNLAGSAISLLDAVKYCINTLQLPAEQALAMASRVPATFMKLNNRYGTFKPGFTSDICWLDNDWNCAGVWRAGQKI
ncbi:N-acetylglucosamine-6-phosphate deacetylase [Reinekea marina]|uniref:N-acetylglucosamine-6-phosphate deacetylase n=1 Tax=Reinekea marina TaxID=1310421 RepID=A0ABV7WTA4_9GAMM|nr:N-acetylglucosamine-6-phosphate deacetylase [Reinekea marina]MDN3650450.1 N-acetylglucosamine-6-phosphate deacetylase [Reinekea marina]